MLAALDAKKESSGNAKAKVVKLPPLDDPTEVFYRYSDMVFRLAYARCRNRTDAEDVMQEVFVRYVKANPSFETAEHQRAWLIRTTVNRTNSMLTSAWRRNRAELSEDIAAVPETSYTGVYVAVMKLPKAQRTAIHLFYYEGYRVREIASLMGANPSTVKSWLHRARTKLEDELKGDYFDV